MGREIERAVSKRHPVVALKVDSAPLTAAFEYQRQIDRGFAVHGHE
jgi:hypothetical protein